MTILDFKPAAPVLPSRSTADFPAETPAVAPAPITWRRRSRRFLDSFRDCIDVVAGSIVLFLVLILLAVAPRLVANDVEIEEIESPTGHCDICGPVILDQFGRCSLAGDHWRYHFILTKGTEVIGGR
jgi:hypothetical protein